MLASKTGCHVEIIQQCPKCLTTSKKDISEGSNCNFDCPFVKSPWFSRSCADAHNVITDGTNYYRVTGVDMLVIPDGYQTSLYDFPVSDNPA